jgi:branched-chain amino acid aminotransferase
MHIDPGLTKTQTADLTMQVLSANLPLIDEKDDYWVTQRFTRGVRGALEKNNPTVIIECYPLPFIERAGYYRDGLQIITPSIQRTSPEAMSPRAKTHNYANIIQGDLEVKAQNSDAQAILLDVNGNICEGSGANFFIVKAKGLVTPKEQYVLPGISRKVTIELAHELEMPIRDDDIDLFDVYTADEAFVTSTSYCICPVRSVNGTMIGDEVPGPVTVRLQEAYSRICGIDFVGQYLSWLK